MLVSYSTIVVFHIYQRYVKFMVKWSGIPAALKCLCSAAVMRYADIGTGPQLLSARTTS